MDGVTIMVPLALNIIAILLEPDEAIILETLNTQPNSGLSKTSLCIVEPNPYCEVALAGGNI